jgi:hypothetical protein
MHIKLCRSCPLHMQGWVDVAYSLYQLSYAGSHFSYKALTFACHVFQVQSHIKDTDIIPFMAK